MTVEYVSVAEARDLRGLRLVLSAGTPGPWGISARALFTARGVTFVAVRQNLMQPNEELRAWTGVRNAPVAVYDDEPALHNWLDLIMLAERLGSGPSLLPDDPIDRALAIGFSAEICGHGGFGWSRRLDMAGNSDAPRAPAMAVYGLRDDAIREAPRRVISIMDGLAAQLRRQAEAGSDYLVGDRLSAPDLHWAAFSQLVAVLPQADCPMPDGMRSVYEAMSAEVRAAVDPLLIAHRDRVFARHIGLPLDF